VTGRDFRIPVKIHVGVMIVRVVVVNLGVMMNSMFRCFAVLVVVGLIVPLSGCETTEVSYVKQAAVISLERVPTEDVLVSSVEAYEEQGSLVVYGKVKRALGNCCDAAKGHVEIAVIAPDGRVFDVIKVAYSPRNIPKTRSRSSRFEAKLSYIPPRDFTLRVTYHDSVYLAMLTD